MATNIEATTLGTAVRSRPRRVQFQDLFDVITATVAVTEASIAAQVGSGGTFTVPGVELGDFVFISFGVDVPGLVVHASPSAADTIRVLVFNVEGTDAVTALSGGVSANVIVLKPKKRPSNWAQN
jgi:hypothetical protein